MTRIKGVPYRVNISTTTLRANSFLFRGTLGTTGETGFFIGTKNANRQTIKASLLEDRLKSYTPGSVFSLNENTKGARVYTVQTFFYFLKETPAGVVIMDPQTQPPDVIEVKTKIFSSSINTPFHLTAKLNSPTNRTNATVTFDATTLSTNKLTFNRIG